MSFTDQYFILSMCVMKELHNSSASPSPHSTKEKLPPSHSISAIFFDKFPLLFHLNGTVPTPSLTIEFLEKLKTHVFVLNEFVKEDYYLPPPEALNTDNILHIASTTLGYPYEKTWKTVNKLVRGGLVFANTEPSTIHTYITTSDDNATAAQYICSTYGDAYVKETVEWKEGIYPMRVTRFPMPEDDPLYTLIWERAIHSSMKPAYYHRYRLSIDTPVLNASFVHHLDVPIFRGWTRLASSSLANSISSLEDAKRVVHPTTPHNVLLFLLSLNRKSPLFCKWVVAESRVSP